MFSSRYSLLVAAIVLITNVATEVLAQTKVDAPEAPSKDAVATFRGNTAEVMAMAFNSDGSQVASVSPKDVRVWETSTGTEITGTAFAGGFVVAISPNGKSLATAQFTNVLERTAVVHSVTDGKELLTIHPHADVTQRTAFGSLVGALAFSPDGKRRAETD